MCYDIGDMSGHSKWSTIKRQKGIADAKKGAIFTRYANLIALAAREGGGDPSTNFKLKMVIDQSRSVNMPKENIDRAIKRGTGELGGERIEPAIYEVYGPSGVGFVVEAATDNKNRTIGELKLVLNKNGGKQASPGSVQFLFAHKGRIIAQYKGNPEEGELTIIDLDAENYSVENDLFLIITSSTDLMKIKTELEKNNFVIEEAELVWEPNTTIKITDESEAQKIEKLSEALSSLNDVTGVYTNAEIVTKDI